MNNRAKWIWEFDGWNDFSKYAESGQNFNARFAFNAANMMAGVIKCPKQNQNELAEAIKVEVIQFEAFYTAEIEGENPNLKNLGSSIKYHFSRLNNEPRKDKRQSIAHMMVDLYTNFDNPLTEQDLRVWNILLTDDDDSVKSGDYRNHKEDMIVSSSGVYGSDDIDYKAPPSKDVPALMKKFVSWFNDTAPNGPTPLPPVTRAALAHLYFVSIHPFEDGNGRISRALSEKALSQSLGKPTLISLSQAISNKKKKYYSTLKSAQSGINGEQPNAQPWLDYFGKTVLTAQELTRNRLQIAVLKNEILEKHEDMRPSQHHALERIFTIIDKRQLFRGGIDTDKYIKLSETKTTVVSPEQAKADLDDLMDRGLLTKNEDGKFYLNTGHLYDSASLANAPNTSTKINRAPCHAPS